MGNSFGRRTSQKPNPSPPVMTKFARPAAPPAVTPMPEAHGLDAELRDWKKTRRSNFPVKLLAMTASVSFGIASVALPKEINDGVQYPLYALSALSLYWGFRRKRQ